MLSFGECWSQWHGLGLCCRLISGPRLRKALDYAVEVETGSTLVTV